MNNEHIVRFRLWVQDNRRTGVNGTLKSDHYVAPSLLEQYWDTEKVQHILDDFHLHENVDHITRDFLRIFSTLVYAGIPDTISLFLRENRDDVQLPISELPYEWPPIMQSFRDQQWMFCPLQFNKDQLMYKRELDVKQILPVTILSSLKGNAGSGDSPSFQKVQIHPECSTGWKTNTPVVFKVFQGDAMRNSYRAEAPIRSRLSDSASAQEIFVQSYGSFSFERTGMRVIILEYAPNGSLLDFFKDTLPPVTSEEYSMFWRQLLKLVAALYVFQNLSRPPIDAETTHHFTAGIHGNIQPSNILVFPNSARDPPEEDSRFDVCFKFADFGFSEFNNVLRDDDRLDVNPMYGAPEYSFNHAFQPTVRPQVSAKADIWSLGAVLSDALVWSISGEPGRQQYLEFRRKAIAELGHIKTKGSEACFHDGEAVLDAVPKFHAKVLTDKRRDDHISEQMSKLILSELLRHADSRVSADTLMSRVDEFKQMNELILPDFSTHPEPNTPAGEIPLIHPTSREIPLVDLRIGFKSVNQGYVKLEQSYMHKEGGTIQRGLYSVERGFGETSDVFHVAGWIEWSADQLEQQEGNVVQKFAVKRLHKQTAPEQFWGEYNSLKLLKSLNHPHVVKTLSVFRYEENRDQYFNFLFPLALGNLKRLFRGSYDENLRLLERAQDSLWGQIAGLSSAVAYLHRSVQMAHRDIKPSNILVYEEPAPGGALVLKLTDFGLAIDLAKALTWEAGSVARQSAWLYDSPEIRRATPDAGPQTPGSEKLRVPSSADLLANDIWKLGCVFTELVAFLVCGGSVGVTGFRDYITTAEDNLSSDISTDTRFDDGETVKVQVLEWLGRMARRSTLAARLQPILSQMLAKSAERPTIEMVCKELIQNEFPNIRYDDGLRIATFTPADRTIPLSRRETIQLNIENWFGRPVDWWPFPDPRPRLRPDQFLMTWECQGSELCMSLSRDELSRYKPMCLPRATNNIPLLPITNPPPNLSGRRPANALASTTTQARGISSPPPLGNVALGRAAVRSSATPPTPKPTKDMYWCVEKSFTEPTETHLFPILDSETLKDDEELYRQVNKAIRSACGWIGWLFSWKRVTDVEFVKFYVVRHDDSEVDSLKAGLLPPVSARDYTHSVPSPRNIQMRAARKQMVRGLKYPKKERGKTTITSMLPKKQNPPPFARDMGKFGWGLHAKMGFSQWRFLCWLIGCFILNVIFVALWLVYVNSTDLQNAFVPAAFSTAVLTFGLAVIQISEMIVGK